MRRRNSFFYRRRRAAVDTVYVASLDWCDQFGDDAPLAEVYATTEAKLRTAVNNVRASLILDEEEASGMPRYRIEEALCDETEAYSWPQFQKKFISGLIPRYRQDVEETLNRSGYYIMWP